MIRILLSVLCIAGVTCSQPASAQTLETSIVGTWKLKSFTRKDIQSGAVTNIFGEHPVGYLVYTKGKRIFAFLVGTSRTPPAKAEATDNERAELFKSMVGYTGTYRVEGDKIVARADASWIQSWTGVDRTQQVEVVGDQLTISATLTAPSDGKQVLVSNVWERVE
jgi:hypothetical protein